MLKKDTEEIKRLLSFLDKKPYVVLHAFATDIRKAWPKENYIPLADWLCQNSFEVVFTGSAENFDEVENIISKMKYKGINTCGTTSIGGLAAILQKSSLLIGADTGPLHLARSVNTPTVGLYWAFRDCNLFTSTYFFRNINPKVVCLTAKNVLKF